MDIFEYLDRTEPGLPTPPTASVRPDADADADATSDPRSRLTRLGRSVYKEVWDEFYAWEPGYCTQILATVPQPFPASKRQVTRVAKAMVARLVDDAEWQERVAALKRTVHRSGSLGGRDTAVVSVTHFPANASGGGKRTNVPIPVITIDALPPHPKYESCPPISRSVLVDSAHEHTLSFLPYADDKRFTAEKYQAKFKFLEWEIPFDPDGESISFSIATTVKNFLCATVEVIQIEAVKRLIATHKVEIPEIEKTKVFKKIRGEHNLGLQWEQSQRFVIYSCQISFRFIL